MTGRHLRSWIALAWTTALGACATGMDGADATANAHAASADRWVVVMTDPRAPRRRGWSTGVGYAGATAYESDPALKRLANHLRARYPVHLVEQWPVRALNVHCVIVELREDGEATLTALRADPKVEWVQPLNEFEARGAAGPAADPYQQLQSSFELLNLGELPASLTGRGIRLAMIDSGVEADHPELAAALATNHNVVNAGEPPAERHGTGVAGVLVAKTDNGVGIAGVAPGARLLAYRACWQTSGSKARCNSLSLSRALDHLAAAPPHIVNLSLTGPEDPLLERLLDVLLAAGTYVVTAHDDARNATARFPRARAGIFVAENGSQATAASRNTYYAPGQAILTAQPGHSYDFMTGHSLAAAHVSGVLALMLEANPRAGFAGAAASLSQSTRRAGTTMSIDACRAVSLISSQHPCGSAAPSASAQQTVETQPVRVAATGRKDPSR